MIFKSSLSPLSRANSFFFLFLQKFFLRGLLLSTFLCLDTISWAQIRENSAVLLAPALDVFMGDGTSEENYYVLIIIIAASLLAAILAANIAYFAKLLSMRLLIRIFGVWFLFATGVSAIALSMYVGTREQAPVIRARETSKPRDIRVEISDAALIVRWRTDSLTTGLLKYRSELQTTFLTLLSNQGTPSDTHEVEIPRRQDDKEYWIVIFSDGIEYRLNGEELYLQL